MKTKNIGFWAVAAVMANLLAAPVAHSQTERFSASLSGAEEVPPINTAGTAAFEMTIQQGTITFSLTFSDLSSPLSVAHLHFAPSKVAGGVMIFLCGGGGQPACPAVTEGTITGTITAANVTGPGGQGIAPGDLDSALEAVRDGLAYANMHTANFGGGEIRGQVRRGAGHARGGE
jgi:CHRD domain